MNAKRVLIRAEAAREVEAVRRTPLLVKVFVSSAKAAADGLREVGEGISMLALQMANRKLAERVRELEKKAERLQDDLIDALDESNDRKERITELEAEVERLREDATLGADLRCVLESGFEVEVNRGEWSICIERWSPFAPLAETAAVVREWQEGQKPEPAPTPEDAARARIAAAGATIHEGRALRVEAENGVWSTRSVVEDEAWVLEELAAFAEANRASQEPPGAAPRHRSAPYQPNGVCGGLEGRTIA